MARKKMRKFSEGGSDKYKARYDRKVADIESDYKKAQGRKTGRDAEVAKAKYEQRMADAKDDLAKWTKSDRTATRAAESAAEKNLSMTRKFGARSSEGLVAKAEDKLADKAPLSSVNVPAASVPKQSFKEAFAAARKAGDKTFKWEGKSFTTQLKGEGPKRTGVGKTGAGVGKTGATSGLSTPAERSARTTYAGIMAKNFADREKGPKPAAGSTSPNPKADIRARAVKALDESSAKKREAEKSSLHYSALNMLGRGSDADARLAQQYRNQMDRERKYKAAVAAREAADAAREAAGRKPGPGSAFASEVDKTKGIYKAKGGKVKKFNKGGSTGEDKRRSVLGSDKDIIGRGNRTPYEPIPKTGPDKPKSKPLGRAGKAGFKSGGSVMKKGMDGVAKKGHTKGMMPKMACGGKMKGYAKGGSIDGIAMKGKTRCKGAK